MVLLPKSSHGYAMNGSNNLFRAPARLVALSVVAVLLAASTLVPSLSYAQKYADHLSHYGGYDARVATLSGFTALYVSPKAPRLPVVLAMPSETDMAAVLPTSCAMDKIVIPCVAGHSAPMAGGFDYELSHTSPAGQHPTALRGPPRLAA